MKGKSFYFIGIFFVAFGLVRGFIGWNLIDYETYKMASLVFEELPGNEVATQHYNIAKQVWLSELGLMLQLITMSFIGGLILMGLGKIIVNQEKQEG